LLCARAGLVAALQRSNRRRGLAGAAGSILCPKDCANPPAGQRLSDRIRERLERLIENLKLGPSGDFAIVADGPSSAI
jgi:hypothetical protein